MEEEQKTTEEKKEVMETEEVKEEQPEETSSEEAPEAEEKEEETPEVRTEEMQESEAGQEEKEAEPEGSPAEPEPEKEEAPEEETPEPEPEPEEEPEEKPAAAGPLGPLAGKAAEVEEERPEEEEKEEAPEEEEALATHIYALRTTANREDQVMDFVASNAAKKKLGVYSVIRPHGMRGYIFVEAEKRLEAEQAAFNVPYARGILPKEVGYKEIEHMLEQVKRDINIKKNDIAEIISGPFKREKCKITRVDKVKEEVVVELLESAVPIPMTLKMDSVKVIRREGEEEEAEE